MNILSFLIIGLIAGWVASTLTEGHGLGIVRDIIVGVIGAFVGGFIFSIFGVATFGFWGTVATSVVGAMAFLFIVGLFTDRSKSLPLSRS